MPEFNQTQLRKFTFRQKSFRQLKVNNDLMTKNISKLLRYTFPCGGPIPLFT